MLNATQRDNETLIVTSDGNSTVGYNFFENVTTQLPCEFLCDYSDNYEIPTTAEKAVKIFTKPTDLISFVLCIVGITANGVSVIAVTRLSQKTTHLKLIISLCVSDALILAGILFYNLMYIFTSWYTCVRITLRLTTDLALLATLTNLLAMALDHCAAIMKPLHYKQKMTKFRGSCVVCGIWAFSSVAVLVEILISLASWKDQRKSFCEVIAYGPFHIEIFIIGFIFVVLIGIVLIYGRIYSRVRKVMVMPRRLRAKSHTESGSVKALMTTVLFVGTFVIFWAPDGIFKVYMYVKSVTDEQYVLRNLQEITMIGDILFVVLLLNALADPLIYAMRLPKVNKGFVAFFTRSGKQSTVKRDKTSTCLRS